MSSSGEFSETERRAVYRAIYERRDVRNYRPDPLPDEVLARVLEAAHQAPSVGFMQPWNFLLLRDRGLREQVYAHFLEVNARAAQVWQDDRRQKYQSLKLQGILDAPLNVLVTCDTQRGGEQVLGRFTIRETDVYSTCLAVQNLWLAARAENVGMGWMSIMEPAVIASLLGLPDSVIPVAYLTLGYPIEFAHKPMLSQVGWRDRLPLADLLYEDHWGQRLAQPLGSERPPAGEPSGAREGEIQALEIPPEASARNRELTKPEGSLGELELLALRLCALQRTPYPRADAVHLALFAADHGVTEEHVSAYRTDTTLKLVYGYLAGAGVVNAFARQQDVRVHVVDVGVDHDFQGARGLIDRKVRRGTRNLAREAAMTHEECADAERAGRELVLGLSKLEVLALGEVGIGNTTSAAALAAALLSLSVEEATGRGTGLDDASLAHKREVVRRALALHASDDPNELLRRLGGYEIAALVGAIEAAAERRALILVDGLITAVAALIAVRRHPALASYLVASHPGSEPALAHLLQALHARPLLALELRLGEGSGATLAVGLVRAACALMSEVRTFEEANISRPERAAR